MAENGNGKNGSALKKIAIAVVSSLLFLILSTFAANGILNNKNLALSTQALEFLKDDAARMRAELAREIAKREALEERVRLAELEIVRLRR